MDPATPPRAAPTTRSITAAQCRAARAMSNWSIGRLSREAEIPVSDIVALECGRLLIRAATYGSLIRAFRRGGVHFLPGEGLRLARESGDGPRDVGTGDGRASRRDPRDAIDPSDSRGKFF